jgi:hypothetical protein
VAAAEVLAEVIGFPARDAVLDEDDVRSLRDTLARLAAKERWELMRRAQAAVRLVAEDENRSELRQVWREDGTGQGWEASVADLMDRLVAAQHAHSEPPE